MSARPGCSGRPLARLRRDERGSASIEFVLLFPIFMSLFLSSIEMGVVMIRQVMLERALDIAVRELRLGAWPNMTQDLLKQRICARAGIIPNCEDEMLLELRPVRAPDYTLPDPAATCRDRSANIQPVVTFRDGPENELMIVRACVLIDPIIPGSGLGMKMQENTRDGFALVATSAYVNEPGAGGN
ncbi:TadE/TadG family type IV pilus assembly protein [Actibacterium sp. MT2.3-13A]|uniref:TadE/TadG family type IV pilus assembly protein n=1 Tax=Actibacterium sp. MT2.3-13A TaxID=2828332 RepID=UPI001BA7372D|nr:TadE/TadG family type IV pilus assembly protein [Actibacterium sp. MT2.3-13A]